MLDQVDPYQRRYLIKIELKHFLSINIFLDVADSEFIVIKSLKKIQSLILKMILCKFQFICSFLICIFCMKKKKSSKNVKTKKTYDT